MGMFKASDLTSLKKQMEKSDIKAGAYMVRSLDGHTNKIIEVKR